MKWFKHDATARNDTRIKLLKKKFGAEGYGVYFQLLEVIGENIKEDNQQEWGFVEEIHTIETLADESGVSPDKLRKILAYCNELGLFYKIDDKLCCPKILNRLDEYAQRRKDGINVKERMDQLIRQGRDTIGTQSGQYRGLEQNRIEKNRTEEKRRENPHTSLEGISELDLQEISERYSQEFGREIPISFVASKYDDLKTYCGSTGKTYKNYFLTLCQWVKRDAQKLLTDHRKESAYAASKTAIDATNL